MIRNITWPEIKERVSRLDKSLKYYGVPRGGQYIAAMLNPVDTPQEADIIIDDLLDSGATQKKWNQLYPEKPFVALFDKKKEMQGEWLHFPWEQNADRDIEDHIARFIQYFDDINREGLKDTPRRYLKFFKEFLSPPEFDFTTFDAENMNEIVAVTNIPFYSLCEHHLAPFFGTASIAYIPDGKIVGISKLPRVLDLYSRRFQNQERITTQVLEHIKSHLHPKGIAVVLRAQHLCMAMRGVKKHDTWTVTSKMDGVFKTDLNARQEVLKLIQTP